MLTIALIEAKDTSNLILLTLDFLRLNIRHFYFFFHNIILIHIAVYIVGLIYFIAFMFNVAIGVTS